MSMKTSNDPVGTGACNFPAFNAVSQPTAPPRAPFVIRLVPPPPPPHVILQHALDMAEQQSRFAALNFFG